MEEKKQISVPAIKEGTVIDHIPSRVTLKIMKLVDPQEFEHVITLGLNLFSQKIGKKGVIKMSNRFLTEKEVEKIAILAPQATVNIIKNYEVEKKIKVTPPKLIERSVKCPNPNCITNLEKVTTKFLLESEEPLKLKCHYCERSIGRDDILLLRENSWIKMLETNLCGIKLKNPTILASGILGVTTASVKFCADHGAGAVTIKSITKEPRKGHNQPIVHTFEGGMMNAVGYSNPGFEDALEEFKDLKRVGCPVIGSVVAKDAEEFAFMTENFVNKLNFDALEIPLSCPHTPGFGTMAGHSTPEATYEITKIVKDRTKIPVIIKLSPNVNNIGTVAKSAQDAGADAICAVNSMGPGMIIDTSSGKKVLGFGMGGVHGEALKPIAIRTVYDIYDFVNIPIIGTGGVSTGDDAVQMIMAGASAVGIGTAVVTKGASVFSKVSDEIKEFMEKNGYTKIKQMVGIAHERK